MAYPIPTTKQLFDSYLSRLETQLGQDAPINDRAFLRVLSAAMSGLSIGHYKYAADRAQANLALTAVGEDLDRIGLDNSTPRKLAETAVLEATLLATTGTVIPAAREFVSDVNGLRYKTEAEVTAVAGVATLSLRCTESGTDGNMENGETLSISAQIAGAETQATVTDTTTTGAVKETDANYRPRVLFAQRAVTGGGNASDHKIWSEAVAGVKRAFPYTGRPAYAGASYPGDRLVYIECQTSIDSDGIPPAPLLDQVRAAINTDPDTGLSRATLGLTDATLWVEPIIRTPIYVQISDLDVEAAQEAACKSDIEDALELYLRGISPFVDGVDAEQERMDTITNISMSDIVQDVLFSYGANAQTVVFGLVVDVFIPLYFLNAGELAKLGGIAYV
jgi:uncharacterized phage protein gp47/JayE